MASLTPAAVITIGISPTLELGPLTLAWHGITTAAGIALGLWLARRHARRRGLAADHVLAAGFAMALAGLVGARALFLAVNDPPLCCARPTGSAGTATRSTAESPRASSPPRSTSAATGST